MSSLSLETRLMWGMPITVAIVESAFGSLFSSRQNREIEDCENFLRPEPALTAYKATDLISLVFDYFEYIDDKFSTYKSNSEISLINRGVLSIEDASPDMRTVFDLAEKWRVETGGYFNITHDSKIDPSGLVKGWALSNAANMLCNSGCDSFYVEAGGDFQAVGSNAEGESWRVGIRNPFNTSEIVKVLSISNRGVATSGTYIRGQHIYDPVTGKPTDPEILSMTVVGPDVYQADCYATTAFAMGRQGIRFIESLDGFEGYMIDHRQRATFTSGFDRYVNHENH